MKVCESMAKKTKPHQSAAAQLSLRIALVHFKPEEDDSLNQRQKLEATLCIFVLTTLNLSAPFSQ